MSRRANCGKEWEVSGQKWGNVVTYLFIYYYYYYYLYFLYIFLVITVRFNHSETNLNLPHWHKNVPHHRWLVLRGPIIKY